jgi:hypothetical protein
MFRKRTAAIAAPALLVLALAGCTPGDSAPASGAGGGSTTGCLAGKTWVLDIDDLASQLGAQLSSGGLNVTQSEADGRQTFEFTAAGLATAQVDVTYTITIVNDDLTLTLVQTHGGDSGGGWAWLGDSTTLTFTDWDNAGYSVQNQFLINGTATESQITIPSEALGGTDMETECSGSQLSTHVLSSPFTQHWTAEG